MSDQSKKPAKAWRVEKVAPATDPKIGDGFEVFVTPIYYGDDEKGPKVGEVLAPGEVKP